jgi:SPP1 gp7 family putative phage head morphogenesis protein
MREIVRLYKGALKTIDAEIVRVATMWEGAGRAERLKALRAARAVVRNEVRRFARVAANAIEKSAGDELQRGIDAARSQLAELGTSFGAPNIGALEFTAGVLSDGSPIVEILREYGAEAARQMAVKFFAGVTKGQNPRAVARAMRSVSQMPMRRALIISRTEMLRAYREASRQTYKANAVREWIWHSALGPRTCAMCYAMHGTRHPVTEQLSSHPACRCTMIPLVSDISVTPGTLEFARLSANEQRDILGPGKYDAFENGRFRLPDLVKRGRSSKWGPYRREKTLAEVLNG